MRAISALRWRITSPCWTGRWAIPLRASGDCVVGLRPAATWQAGRRQDSLTSPSQARRIFTQTHADDSTIYALSTASGRAAIAIIRISGPACLDIYRALCPGENYPKPRYATVRTLWQPNQIPFEEAVLPYPEAVLDSNALVLYFPAPRTVTGEDVLELHVHGGPAIVKAVLAAIPKCSSAVRYAEPGEFTRRAFLNDRLDLTQVEALGDALSATTEQQRRLSVRGTTGGLAKRYEEWRHRLLYARGELEALIDFSEDQHFDESPTELCASVSAQVEALMRNLQAHILNAMKGEMLRNGISIALLGAPNAGKSSLLNCIVGRQAAIVSHEAGTTRDVVEVGLDLGGYFCNLGDTAGLRKAVTATPSALQTREVIGHIEEEGMRRAKARAAESDVLIVVMSFENIAGSYTLHLDTEVTSSAAALVREKDNVIVVVNKSDFVSHKRFARDRAIRTILAALPGISNDRIHLISCKEANSADEGTVAAKQLSEADSHDPGNLQGFLHGLIRHFGAMTAAVIPDPAAGDNGDADHGASGTDHDASVWQDSLGASERHRLLLEKCLESLRAFLSEVQPGAGAESGESEEADIVVAAEHLRAAGECLAKITGKGVSGDVEEVLGVVFEKFCVGK